MSHIFPLPSDLPEFLSPYLPKSVEAKPFVTLTYAQSLDSKIAAKPGTRTAISHLETKTMTHYLRSVHDGILIGSGTVLADDPGLNCRFKENGNINTPRPIILDPSFKWDYKGSKLELLVSRNESLKPWIIINDDSNDNIKEKIQYVENSGGRIIKIARNSDGKIKWEDILKTLHRLRIKSLMIEGGAKIINDLLERDDLVNSLIVTIGPTFLGQQGVDVSPLELVKLENTQWWTGTQDVILAANLQHN
ncbi:hypothetical protein WICMUC_003646 [Wickerhamomyces mucosus]|uniref:2,5-diamino-6-ribosylamino-4(3H)-pyrimidinone 5'-phosphate reductase n=1 Tax=Wickerhamomyces mucosus TaxID=1378264 RepID=A0A9P8PLE1_9ASCO|nr:hypothetical protein WICMUC_003646 [Wickerhamomyces mucosus]